MKFIARTKKGHWCHKCGIYIASYSSCFVGYGNYYCCGCRHEMARRVTIYPAKREKINSINFLVGLLFKISLLLIVVAAIAEYGVIK